ncbi:MAG: hypothetical protein ABIA04_06190, partial [Pseudomonadota bacterium]
MIGINNQTFLSTLGGKLSLLFIFTILFATMAFAAHTSTVDLQPEWSSADSDIDYTVTFCKTSGETVNEVRIYKNYDGSIFYTGFQCDDKLGWEKLYIGTYPACFYVSDGSNPIDVDGECQDFTFSAHTPPAGEQYCDLNWRFETRDIDEYWQFLYDTTSVDNAVPLITKDLVGGTQSGPCPPGAGEECWMTQDTQIIVSVIDQGDCGISQLDYCTYSYTVDGVPHFEHTFDPEEPSQGISWEIYFDEDSVHELYIECADEAGNTVEDTEVFRVDSTPPETEKVYGAPHFPDPIVENEYPHWINTNTPITMSAVDPDPTGYECNIGVTETYYRNIFYGPGELDNYCASYEACQTWEPCVINPIKSDCDGDCPSPCEEWIPYTGEFYKQEESCHIIEYYSVDELGNTEPINWQCVYVDNRAPTVWKEHGEGMIWDYDEVLGEFHWMTQETPIDLYCKDNDPHPVDNVSLWYRTWNDLTGTWTEWQDPTDYAEVQKTIYFTEDSVHKLQYYCVDALGNSDGTQEEPYEQTYRVDSTPPIIEKTMIGDNHLGECPPVNPEDECFVADNGENGVHVAVYDPDPTDMGCNVDEVSCEFTLIWDATEEECKEAQGEYLGDNECLVNAGEFGEEGKDIIFTEDSMHTLTVTCEDALENSVEDIEVFLVDSTPPVTTKTYGKPTVVAGDYRWIKTSTPITLTAEDEKVGVNTINWRVTLLEDIPDELCYETCQYEGYDGFNSVESDTTEFNIGEESCHLIEFYSDDLLGNTEIMKRQCVFVDDSPPLVWKTIGEPKYGGNEFVVNGGFESGDTTGWTVSDGHVYATEEAAHTGTYGINFEEIGNCHTDSISQEIVIPAEATDTILSFWLRTPFFDEGFDYIAIYFNGDLLLQEWYPPTNWTYYSFDVGSYAGQEGTLTLQFVKSETTDCIIGSNLQLDDVSVSSGSSGDLYITQKTPITLTCEDVMPHPVNQVSLKYRYRISDDCESWGDWTEWYDPEGTEVEKIIFFGEDSCHELEYKCEDALGNATETFSEIDIVDTMAPEISREIVGPQIELPCEDKEETCTFIDGVTVIEITATDPAPHPVNEVECKWGYYLDAGEFYGWYTEFPINFPEETQHDLVVECWDALGNTSDYSETFYVDKTPPVTDHELGIPFYAENGKEWMTTATPVTLSVDDAGPHKTGIKETKYRITKLDNEGYCDTENQEYICEDAVSEGEWMNYSSEPFFAGEESCHLIEYYSIDNVNKTEEIKKKCIYVDETGPETVKTVGEPSDVWDGADSAYYPEIVDHCGIDLDCWKVTLLTPITLDCNDPLPHPV